MLEEELPSSLPAWLRLPRLLAGEVSAGWWGRLGRMVAAWVKFSCSDGWEDPSARGCQQKET